MFRPYVNPHANLSNLLRPLNVHVFNTNTISIHIANTAIVPPHPRRKRIMRLPPGRRPWRALLQHPVDLLQREALRLIYKEVHKQEADAAGAAPDEEDLRAKISLVAIDNVGCDNADDLG